MEGWTEASIAESQKAARVSGGRVASERGSWGLASGHHKREDGVPCWRSIATGVQRWC